MTVFHELTKSFILYALASFYFGELWSYGQNSYGELGTGDMISRLEPTCVCIADDVDIAQVAAGGSLCHYVSY